MAKRIVWHRVAPSASYWRYCRCCRHTALVPRASTRVGRRMLSRLSRASAHQTSFQRLAKARCSSSKLIVARASTMAATLSGPAAVTAFIEDLNTKYELVRTTTRSRAGTKLTGLPILFQVHKTYEDNFWATKMALQVRPRVVGCALCWSINPTDVAGKQQRTPG
jgi:hypothetical protein